MAKQYNDLEDQDYVNKSLEIDGQTINYRTSTVEPVEQDFIKLNETDREFIDYCIGDADDLLQTLEGKSISNYTAKDLDELLFKWINKKHDFKYFEEMQFVNAIGAAFGNCLNREFDTIWSVISDEYGTDYACISTNEFSYQLFPFSSAWKAIEQSREDSLYAIIQIVRNSIEDNKADNKI